MPGARKQANANICITNQKGGCGKTNTATNLAAGLARKGERVLLMDLDPQAPIASGVGVKPPEDMLPIAEALRKKRLQEIVCETPIAGLFVTPGDVSLDHQALANEPLRDTILQRALAPLHGRVRLHPHRHRPASRPRDLNAIMAADWLILPCEADKESLLSLKRTLEVAFEYIQHRPEVDPEGFYKVLWTICDDRDKTINDWFAQQLKKLGNPPLRTVIHKATAFKKARGHGLSIFDYREKFPESPGRRAGPPISNDSPRRSFRMNPREEIPASIDLPPTPARRMGAAEKARALIMPVPDPAPAGGLGRPGDAPVGTFAKLTTRVPPDQLEWLKGEAKRYRAEHPRAPKVTIEELIRVAIDHLKEAKNLDALIAKHRV